MARKLADQAADPNTPLERLAELAFAHEKLRATIALNPSTYPDLLTWLGEIGDPEVDFALRKRNGSQTLSDLARDPDTDPARLAEIAYAHPELRDSISRNPACYDDLKSWISEAGLTPPPKSDVSSETVVRSAREPQVVASPKRSIMAKAKDRYGEGFLLNKVVPLGLIAIVSIASIFAFGFGFESLRLGINGLSLVGNSGDGEGLGPSTEEAVELPGCPSGWAPISRYSWSDGEILVCSQTATGKLTSYLRADGSVSQSASVLVAPTGISARFETGRVDIAFDGLLIWVNGDAAITPDHGWVSGMGDLDLSRKLGKVPSCPADSFPLSISTWSDGWLMICGAADGTPVNFSYLDGTKSGSGTSIYKDGVRYCGDDETGLKVCVSSSPAVVQFTSSSGAVVQRSAVFNFFPDVGEGGAGKGVGAYGVDSPGDTPEEQVGYLVAILEKSAIARSGVSASLAPLNACNVDASDVDALRALTQARTDLITALQSTPVEQIPDGSHLLNLLLDALQLSEEADKGYVDTALQMQEGSCSAGRATYRNALAIANQAEAAKRAFVNAWNSSISGQFGVKQFSAGDI